MNEKFYSIGLFLNSKWKKLVEIGLKSNKGIVKKDL